MLAKPTLIFLVLVSLHLCATHGPSSPLGTLQPEYIWGRSETHADAYYILFGAEPACHTLPNVDVSSGTGHAARRLLLASQDAAVGDGHCLNASGVRATDKRRRVAAQPAAMQEVRMAVQKADELLKLQGSSMELAIKLKALDLYICATDRNATGACLSHI